LPATRSSRPKVKRTRRPVRLRALSEVPRTNCARRRTRTERYRPRISAPGCSEAMAFTRLTSRQISDYYDTRRVPGYVALALPRTREAAITTRPFRDVSCAGTQQEAGTHVEVERAVGLHRFVRHSKAGADRISAGPAARRQRR